MCRRIAAADELDKGTGNWGLLFEGNRADRQAGCFLDAFLPFSPYHVQNVEYASSRSPPVYA